MSYPLDQYSLWNIYNTTSAFISSVDEFLLQPHKICKTNRLRSQVCGGRSWRVQIPHRKFCQQPETFLAEALANLGTAADNDSQELLFLPQSFRYLEEFSHFFFNLQSLEEWMGTRGLSSDWDRSDWQQRSRKPVGNRLFTTPFSVGSLFIVCSSYTPFRETPYRVQRFTDWTKNYKLINLITV